MAKRKDFDQNQARKFPKRNRQRKEGVRELKVYFLIVCEGEKTEPNYFKSFPNQVHEFVYDLSFGGGGINTIRVVEEAIKIRDKSSQQFDRVWAVFDKDSFSAVDFNAAIDKGEQNDVNCAWSNEAFELWYLLHFQYRNVSMSRADYEGAISKAIADKSGIRTYRYAKNAKDTYADLQRYGSEDDAIRNAKRLSQVHEGSAYASHNPCTTVYKLVEELRGKNTALNEEIKQKYEHGE